MSHGRFSRQKLVLVAGVAGELANGMGLLAINVIGPRYLGPVEYGEYTRVLGSAILALGLIDGPLVARLLVSEGARSSWAPLRNAAICTVGGVCVAVFFAGLSGLSLVGVIALAAGYSLLSNAVHLAYRHGLTFVYPLLACYSAVVSTGALYGTSVVEGGGVRASMIQGGLLCAGASMGLVVASARFGIPPSAAAKEPNLLVLSVPTALAGVAQWILVLIVGRVAGSAAASLARVGTSIIGIPATFVPVSGALLFATAGASSNNRRGAASLLLLVAAGASTVGTLVFVARATVIEVLGGSAFGALEPHFSWLLLGGVGLAMIKSGWLFTVSEVLSSRNAAIVGGVVVALSLAAAAGGLQNWVFGLGSISATYVLAGAIVVGSVFNAARAGKYS